MKKFKLKLKKNDEKIKNNKVKKVKKVRKPKEKKVIWKSILSFLLFWAIILISLFLAFALYIVITSPDFDESALYQKEPTILYDVNGDEMARIGTKDSTIVTFDELPETLVDALIATEDSRFFQHNGLDLVRFLKASFLQLLGSSDAGGASTLSMQVVKNTYTQRGAQESSIESFIRKFKDIYMSVFKLEANYTKEEIIEFYLNSQWFANTGNINVSSGLWGVERASEWYFGKSVKDLNLAESSLIAGMFQNTARYNPYKYPERCRQRQETVLKLLVRHGYITESQMEEVLAIPIESMFVSHDTELKAESNQAFIDYVLTEVANDLNIDPHATSLKIYTTFDPDIQSVLESVENGDAFEFKDDVIQEGIAITSTVDGSIVALSGGRNYQAKGLNRATDIERQPGSTAKPLVEYAMYIEHISQSTYAMFLDEPTTYTNGTSISNYDRAYDGLITMRYALKDSRNIPALLAFKAVSNLDINIMKDFLKNIGIDYGRDLYESASIGGFDKGVSPLELSAAYGTFARGGYYIEPYAYTKVINTETDDELNHSYTKVQVMEESTAYMINNILIEAYGGTGVSGTDIAGKTGTTNLDSDTKKKYGLPSGAVQDAWIVSYSPSYSIAQWVGYDKFDSNSGENGYYINSNTGGTARRRIMNYVATRVHEKNQRFKVPKTITTAEIELETFPAQLCSEYTPSSMCKTEYFVRGTEPTDVSTRYSTLANATNGSYSFNGNTINLTWDKVPTPEAIDTTYLTNHFNEYYGDYATKYYENRIAYNNSTFGTLGYEIYLRNSNGTDQYLGYTSSNTFSYSGILGTNYTFVIKTAYSIFKSNMSSGLTINVQTNIDSNVDDIINGNNGNNNTDTDTNTDNNTTNNNTSTN